MRRSGYRRLFDLRRKEAPTRLVAASIIAVASGMVLESIWTWVWFVGVLVTQAADYAYSRRIWLADRRRRRELIRFYPAILFITSAVYTSISLEFWKSGEPLGQMFAATLCLGAMLHVSIQIHFERRALIAGFTPHAIFFFWIVLDPAAPYDLVTRALVTISGGLYIIHLILAVRRNTMFEADLDRALATARRQKRRAEKADREKAQFLGVMSHEIRTPVNALASAAHLLDGSDLSEEQRRNVALLTDASDSLMGLLNDLLDYSEIDGDQMTLSLAPSDLREMLRSLVSLWEPRALRRAMRLTLRVSDDAPARVLVDSMRLQQAVFNLLSSAVSSLDEGEIILSFDWDAERSTAIIELRHAGDDAWRAQPGPIFDGGGEATDSEASDLDETEYGLLASRRLARMMDGELEIVRTPGWGVRYTLSLPLRPVAADDESTPANLRGRRILAADDNQVNRMILAALLEPQGCELTMTENGLEATNAATRERYDLILLDMEMPVMNGLEAARRIRAGGENRTTPIVALTAYALESHRRAWDDIDIAAFLTKPVDPRWFSATLAGICAAQPPAFSPAERSVAPSASASRAVAEPRRFG